MFRTLLLSSTVVLMLTLAACGGGGSGSVAPPVPSSSPGPADVQFVVNVPASSQNTRTRPNFNAPTGTASITIALLSSSGGVVTISTFNLSGSACTTNASGTSCTETVQAPAGSDVFEITTFAQVNAGGKPTGSGVVTVTAVAGQTVVAAAVLSGTVASISLELQLPTVVPEGVATSAPLVLTAKDANGNVIIGSYANPITLTDTDASGQTHLSATTVPDSTTAAALTFSYSGGAMSQAATISATASSVTGSNAGSATFAPPQNAYPTVNSAKLTYGVVYAEEDGGGAFGPIPPSGIPGVPVTGTQTVTFSTGAQYNGLSNLVDVHTADSGQPWDNLPATSDAYYAWSQAAASATLQFVGETTSGENLISLTGPASSTYAGTCSVPYQQTWIVPFPSGWDALSKSGSCTSADTGGNPPATQTIVQNADGSYAMTLSSSTQGLESWSNASANGTAVTAGAFGSQVEVVAVGTPAPQSTSIPIQVSQVSGPLPSPGATLMPSPSQTSVPNWYAAAGVANDVPPTPLLSDVYTNAGAVTSLPQTCTVASSVVGANPQYQEIDERREDADPAGGYELDVNRYFFEAGIGIVCGIGTTQIDVVPNIWAGPPVALEGEWESFTVYLFASSLQPALSTVSSMNRVPAVLNAGVMAMMHNNRLVTQRSLRHNAVPSRR